MIRSLILPAALTLVLAPTACGRVPEASGNAAIGEHGYIARVQALPPRQRDGVLFRAIQQGGGAVCQNVAQVETMPATRAGQPVWRVTCSEGSQWAVALADDGTAVITGARDAAQ